MIPDVDEAWTPELELPLWDLIPWPLGGPGTWKVRLPGGAFHLWAMTREDHDGRVCRAQVGVSLLQRPPGTPPEASQWQEIEDEDAELHHRGREVVYDQ